MNREGAIWRSTVTPAGLDILCRQTMIGHLGINFLEVGADWISASMPVDERTMQPMGLLHGGALAALAETLGSVGALLCIDDGLRPVGLTLSSNHVRAVRSGSVVGTARPLHRGRTTHVWQVDVIDEKQRLVSTSRITLAILRPEPGATSKGPAEEPGGGMSPLSAGPS